MVMNWFLFATYLFKHVHEKKNDNNNIYYITYIDAKILYRLSSKELEKLNLISACLL